jgi:sugar lactone lactonase YvrE
VNRGLVSVESVYVDARGFLWALDTGSVNFGAVAPRAAKLVQIDPMTNKIAGTFELPGSVALPTSYLEDVRVDVARGAGGTAFISDGSPTGSNAIIVVDLAKKTSWRKLQDHPSVKADPGFVAFVEGEPVYRDPIAGGARKPLTGGVHGLALSADGKRLFYAPLASRRLYSVSTDALANENASDAEVARTIIDHGDKGASDGLETDDRDAIYAASYELNAIERRGADGTLDVVASDSRLLWPNRMAITTDGFLYVTSNQLEREPIFQGGVDHREKPYVLFRVKIDAGKVRSRP